MPGSKNNTYFANGFNILPSSTDEARVMQSQADSVQFYNVDGTPEGAINGNVGSVACDRTNGDIYRKETGTGNTGWVMINGTDLYTSRFIVDNTNPDGANYSTITSALAAASAPATIFVRPGTYVEDLTGKAGVDIVAYDADAQTPNVIIEGNFTASFAGSCSLSGICLRTNGSAFLTVSGSNDTVVNLINSYLDFVDSTGISFTSSSANSRINILYCQGNIGTTGITLFTKTSSGIININWTQVTNTGGSSTASTSSAGGCQIRSSYFNQPFSFSSSAGCDFNNSVVFTNGTNSICITVNSTSGGGNNFFHSRFSSGTAECMTIGASAQARLMQCVLNSTGTNILTGSGTVEYSCLSCPENSGITTTTQNGDYTQLGAWRAGSQPRFSAYLSGDTGGVTGAGTAYTVLFDTELFDVGGIYTPGSGTFTAPVAGVYQFNFSVRMEGVTAAMTNGYLQLTTTGGTYRYGETNPGVGGTRAWAASQLVSMSAGDTATVQIFLANGAGNTANVAGSTTFITVFSGHLVA